MLMLRCWLVVSLFLGCCTARLRAAEPVPAGQLPRSVVPKHYAIRLEAGPDAKQVLGTQTVTIEVREAVSEIQLNALDLTITKAELRGQVDALTQWTMDPKTQVLTLQLSKPLPTGTYELELAWSFILNERAQGLFMARHDASGTEAISLATQMEPADARRMLPCWDEPRFRAAYQLTVTIPGKCQAVSNMPETKNSVLPDGRREVAFAATPSMPSYLLALFIGEYEELTGEVDGIKLRALTTPGKREQARYALEATKLLLPWFNEYFGVKYPLPKLDQISIPGAPAAGMENWGAILYNDTAFLYDPAASSQWTKEGVFGVVAHELAHQWFGNLVTMTWWDDLWLNEGFASWIGTKATAHFNPSWEVWLRAAGDKEWAMWLDARATTHPIQQPVKDAAGALDAFDSITYSKGQSFLRMLEQYLGEAKFRDGLRGYMRQHAYGNTTTVDLWNALGTASGQPVAEIASGWTRQPGFPLVKVATVREGGRTGLAFAQERFAIHQKSPEALTWKIPLSFSEVPGSTDARALLLGAMPGAALLTGVGAVKANVAGSGYYRVQYEAALFGELVKLVPEMTAGDRLNLLHDTWALVQAEKVPARDWLGLMQRVAETDTTYVTWDAIVDQLGFIDELQRGQPGRRAFRDWAAALLIPQLDRIGCDPKAGETELTALLRSTVISALGRWGHAPVIAEARARFARFQESPTSLNGDMRRAVLGIVGQNADAATYATLHRLAKEESSTEQKRILYGALAQSGSTELAQQTLALALTDELLPREATRLVQKVGEDGELSDLAWRFTQANLEVLLAKLPSFGASDFVPGVFRGFSEEARAAELEAFSKSHLPPQAKYAVEKAADNIRFKAAFKARLLPELAEWIAQQSKGTTAP